MQVAVQLMERRVKLSAFPHDGSSYILAYYLSGLSKISRWGFFSFMIQIQARTRQSLFVFSLHKFRHGAK